MTLTGNRLMVEKMELIPPSIAARLNRIKWNFYNTTELPMADDRANFAIAKSAFSAFKEKLDVVLESQKALELNLKELGVYFEE